MPPGVTGRAAPNAVRGNVALMSDATRPGSGDQRAAAHGEPWTRDPDGRLRTGTVFADESFDSEFWQRGGVVAEMLDATEVDDVRARVAALRPSDGWDPRTLPDARSTYHCTFLDGDRSYRRAVDELVRDAFGPKLRQLLPNYRILTANVYSKPPGTGRFEIHQNWPTTADTDIPTITAWVPLVDTSLRNGTLRAIFGSHHAFPDVAAATSDRFFDDFEADLIESYLEPVALTAGQVFAFDDSLVHWSGPNLSDIPRVTFQIELIPDGIEPVLWVVDPDDPGWFLHCSADTEFFLTGGIEDLYGVPRLPVLGRAANPNRRLTRDEFDAALRNASRVRDAKYVHAAP